MREYKGSQEAPAGGAASEDSSGPGKRSLTEQLPRKPVGSGGGEPLPGPLQEKFSAGLGADLSGVRVHTDDKAAAAAESVSARAFATGQDIYFAAGAYDPGSAAGQKVIAHEVTHTVQQGGAAPARDAAPVQTKLTVSQAGDPAENEADAAAEALVSGAPVPRVSAAPPSIARFGDPRSRMGGMGAPFAKPDPPDPAGTAKQYMEKWGKEHLREVQNAFAEITFKLPVDYMAWRSGDSKAFAADVGNHVYIYCETHKGVWEGLTKLLAPDDLEWIVDYGRDKGQPTHAQERHLMVTHELVKYLRLRAQAGLDRYVPRLMEAWNQKQLEKEIEAQKACSKDKVLPDTTYPGWANISQAIDLVVLRAIGDSRATPKLTPHFDEYRKLFPSEKNPHPIRTGTRMFKFTWQAGKGASLWIRVTDPPDTTVDDVASYLYHDSDKTYAVVPAPPLFGIQYELLHEEMKKAANKAGVWYQGDPAKEILKGPMADEAVLNQGAAFKAKGAKAADPLVVSQTLHQIVTHLNLAKEDSSQFGGNKLQATIDRVKSRKQRVDGGDPGEAAMWAGQAAEQLDIVTAAQTGVANAVQYKIAYKDFENAAWIANQIMLDFVDAAEISDLVQTARPKLHQASQRSQTFDVELLEQVLIEIRRTILSAKSNSRTVNSVFKDLVSIDERETKYRARLLALRDKLLTDPEKVREEVKTIRKEIQEFGTEASLFGNVAACDEAHNILEEAKSGPGRVRSWAPGRHGNDELAYQQQIGQAWKNTWMHALELWQKGDHEGARTYANAQTTRWKIFFEDITKEITDQARYDRWMTFGLMVGIAIFTGFVGGLAEVAVGGGVLGFVVSVATEAVVFSALSQAMLAKDPSIKGFISEFEHNLVVFTVLKGFSKAWQFGEELAGAGDLSKIGEITGQFVLMNGIALYEANQAKAKSDGKPLTLGEILSVSQESLAMVFAMALGNKIIAPWTGKWMLRAKYGHDLRAFEAAHFEVKTLSERLEQSKGKDAAARAQINKKLDKYLARQQKFLENLLELSNKSMKERLEAGLTKEQAEGIGNLKADFVDSIARINDARISSKLEPISGGSMMVERGAAYEDAERMYIRREGADAVKPGETDPHGARSFTVKPKDGSPAFTVTERLGPKGAVAVGGDKIATPSGDPAKASTEKPEIAEPHDGGPTADEAARNRRMAEAARRAITIRDGQFAGLVQQATVDGHVMHLFRHITGGGGLTAATDMATRPHAGSGGGPAELNSLPAEAAISAGSEPWSLRGDLEAGQQRYEFKDAKAFRVRPNEFHPNQQGWTKSSEIADSTAMTRWDAGFPTLRDATILEVSVKPDATWKMKDATVRLKVSVGGKEIFVYAGTTDVAMGPGVAKSLTPEQFGADAKNPEGHRKTLEADRRVVYGDGPIGNQIVGGKVVIVGGSATGAWNAEVAAAQHGNAVVVGRDSGRAPTAVDSVVEEYNRNAKELADPDTDAARKIELGKRQAFLHAFGDAMLPRNTKPGGGFDNKGVTPIVDEIVKLEPGEVREPNNPAAKKKVWVEFKNHAERNGYYDQVVVSIGQDIGTPGGGAIPGGVGVVGDIMFRPIWVDGEIVGLESVHPPGAVRVPPGNGMWSRAWIARIEQRYQAQYEEALTKQAKAQSVREKSPNSVGVPGSIHVTGRDMGKFNAELGSPDFNWSRWPGVRSLMTVGRMERIAQRPGGDRALDLIQEMTQLEAAKRVEGMQDWVDFSRNKTPEDFMNTLAELRAARRMVDQYPGRTISVGGDARAPAVKGGQVVRSGTPGAQQLQSFDIEAKTPGGVEISMEVTTMETKVGANERFTKQINHAADKVASRAKAGAGHEIPGEHHLTIEFELDVGTHGRGGGRTIEIDAEGNYKEIEKDKRVIARDGSKGKPNPGNIVENMAKNVTRIEGSKGLKKIVFVAGGKVIGTITQGEGGTWTFSK